jgi:uncharacterized protein YukE
MADVLNYQFAAMQQTNEAVQQRLNEFGTTLDSFKNTYSVLAQQWGGAAAEGATGVAQALDEFGQDVARVVRSFLKALQQHLEDSQHMEKGNADLFQ